MRTEQNRRRLGLVAAGLVTALAVGGCGGSGTTNGATAERADAPAGGLTADRDSSGDKSVTVPVGSPTSNRSIVYKGELTVRAKNVDEAAAEASTIATGAGGIVAGDNRHSTGNDESADLILRVPSAAFYATVNKLGKDLGKELSRGISTDDVTEAVVDLDARIAGQKASVDRTRALLARAQQISEIVTIEQELARRESELASLQARKRTLADQVALSTVTLHLIGPKAAPPAAKAKPANFLTGLAAGWTAFTTTVNGALIVLGAVLPFLVALAIPIAVVAWLLRRRRPRPAPETP